jgi:hypothetical protein
MLQIQAVRKERCGMSANRASIGQVMMVVAMAAVNLAILRATPREFVTYPTLWVLLGAIDLVIFWKLVGKRSLQAFHYTFLIVFVIAFVVMANFAATGRLQPMGLLVRWYQQLSGANTIPESRGITWIEESWMACFLSLALAYVVGMIAAWLERRREWDIAAFFRGAIIGLGIASISAPIVHATWVGAEPSSVLIGDRVILGVCLILGGRMGLSRLRSSMPGHEGRTGMAGE